MSIHLVVRTPASGRIVARYEGRLPGFLLVGPQPWADLVVAGIPEHHQVVVLDDGGGLRVVGRRPVRRLDAAPPGSTAGTGASFAIGGLELLVLAAPDGEHGRPTPPRKAHRRTWPDAGLHAAASALPETARLDDPDPVQVPFLPPTRVGLRLDGSAVDLPPTAPAQAARAGGLPLSRASVDPRITPVLDAVGSAPSAMADPAPAHPPPLPPTARVGSPTPDAVPFDPADPLAGVDLTPQFETGWLDGEQRPTPVDLAMARQWLGPRQGHSSPVGLRTPILWTVASAAAVQCAVLVACLALADEDTLRYGDADALKDRFVTFIAPDPTKPPPEPPLEEEEEPPPPPPPPPPPKPKPEPEPEPIIAEPAPIVPTTAKAVVEKASKTMGQSRLRPGAGLDLRGLDPLNAGRGPGLGRLGGGGGGLGRGAGGAGLGRIRGANTGAGASPMTVSALERPRLGKQLTRTEVGRMRNDAVRRTLDHAKGPKVVDGLSKAEVKAVLDKHVGMVRACVRKARRRQDELRATISVAIHVGPDGRPLKVIARPSHPSAQGVADCVTKQFEKQMRFPRPRGGSLVIARRNYDIGS